METLVVNNTSPNNWMNEYHSLNQTTVSGDNVMNQTASDNNSYISQDSFTTSNNIISLNTYSVSIKSQASVGNTGVLATENVSTEDSTLSINVNTTTSSTNNTKSETKSPQQLTDDEKEKVKELKAIDQKVRTHENAHQMAAGSLVIGKSLEYVTGPDGQQYAMGGEVDIDMSAIPDSPDATISKMEQVKRAALAPSDPSSQDKNVASMASNIEMQAQDQKIQVSSSNKYSAKTAMIKQLNTYSDYSLGNSVGSNLDITNNSYNVNNSNSIQSNNNNNNNYITASNSSQLSS